ncbi:MAG: hypothetical protein ACTSX7_19570 [Alphaproteobacteria bacterium]
MPTVSEGLAALEQQASQVARQSWFAAVGEPLSPGEIEDAQIYLEGLDIDAVSVVGVPGWAAASSLLQQPDWDVRWWDGEERLRRQLLDSATDLYGQDTLLAALTKITLAASDIVHGAAAIAAARGGTADERLSRVAAGAATQACYLAGLATAVASGNSHPFHAKYRLFAAGRWPLTIAGNQFHLF